MEIARKNCWKWNNQNIHLSYKTNLYLPLASVKSLIPPPTVSGTKTFSEVYLKTFRKLEALEKWGISLGVEKKFY